MNDSSLGTSGETWTYTYDLGGNITSKSRYAYTTGALGTALETISYTYGDATWGDLLTAYDGQAITYDQIGNPLTDGTWTYIWEHGRQLATQSSGNTTWDYDYDAGGQRITRTDGNTTYEYGYYGSNLVYEKITQGNTVVAEMYITYGEAGPLYIEYNGTIYYYMLNGQGDVVGLIEWDESPAVRYTYDAWGQLESVSGSLASTLGAHNPLRYRGYVYDAETGLYYVSSRYYDPEVGRWISPEPNVYEGEFDEGAGLIGYNVYAYCANNPVMYKDETGESITLCILIGAGIGLVAGGAFGAYRASKNGYSPSDGWKYWKYVVGYGVAGGAIGALVGWGAGALIAKYGVSTAAASITKGGGARFSSFNALKRSLGSAGRGNQWHHIVEQCQIGKSGFSKYWIQNSNNVINISNSVHSKISAYYNSVHRFTNGMRFRNWLAGQSFKTQYEWGIKVLRMYGVKI